MRPRVTRALALTITSALAWMVLAPMIEHTALGQDRAAPTEGRRGGRRGARSDPAEDRAEAGAREADPDAPETAESAEVDARSTEVTERGGNKVKVIEFSGIDVNGRLKSPQLLYFLNRVRAEFDRPRLPHRSFVPEMERSTKAEGF